MDSRKMTIAAGIFPPDIGGPATYVVKLGNALCKRGWQVRVVCYSSDVGCRMSDVGYSTQPVAGVSVGDRDYSFSVYRVLRRGSRLSRYWHYFWQVVKASKGVDLIYAQGPISAGLPAFFAAKLLRKKFVVKVVGDPAWEQTMGAGLVRDMIDEFQNKKYEARVERLKKIRSFVCRKADKVITPSRYLRDIVKGWGVEESKIVVVYNAIEMLDVTCLPARQGCQMLDVTDDEDIILSVGRLVKWKGFNTLIELMPELLQENPKFKLIILGDGPEKENYQLSIISYQLQNNVKLLGRVSGDEVANWMCRSKMFVLNTGYEGLPHTVLEAMQAGCPVVTTRVGGNPEVVRDGESGLLVEYNNREQLKGAILRLYRDENLCQKLVEQAKIDLGRFDFAKMIDETIQILVG